MIEACAENDFNKARKAISSLEGVASTSYKYDTDVDILYVNDKEIYYLLAENNQFNSDRILFLYNSYEPKLLPDMTDVLEVAITQGNEYLAKRLISSGVALTSKNLSAILSLNDNNLVISALKNAKAVLPPCPEFDTIQVYTYEYYQDEDHRDYANGNPMKIDLVNYTQAVKQYNDNCTEIIKVFLNAENPNKAYEVQSLMKSDIVYSEICECNDSDFSIFAVKLNHDQINEAKKLPN